MTFQLIQPSAKHWSLAASQHASYSEILHNVQTVYPTEETIKRWFGDEELKEWKSI